MENKNYCDVSIIAVNKDLIEMNYVNRITIFKVDSIISPATFLIDLKLKNFLRDANQIPTRNHRSDKLRGMIDIHCNKWSILRFKASEASTSRGSSMFSIE